MRINGESDESGFRSLAIQPIAPQKTQLKQLQKNSAKQPLALKAVSRTAFSGTHFDDRPISLEGMFGELELEELELKELRFLYTRGQRPIRIFRGVWLKKHGA